MEPVASVPSVSGTGHGAFDSASLGGPGVVPSAHLDTPLLEDEDLPRWLRTLEAPPREAAGTDVVHARDNVGSWIVDQDTAEEARPSLPSMNPADSWLRPAASGQQPLTAAETVFATGSAGAAGIHMLQVANPGSQRGGTAKVAHGARPAAGPRVAPVNDGRVLATVALVVAILVFLASLSFFIVTMTRG